jgi:hypothetical protein
VAITQQEFADLYFETLKYPDLAPSDYCLFPDLKKHLKQEIFVFSVYELKKLEQRNHTSVWGSGGVCVEYICFFNP